MKSLIASRKYGCLRLDHTYSCGGSTFTRAVSAVLVISILYAQTGCKKKQAESASPGFNLAAASNATRTNVEPGAPVLTPTSAKIGPQGGTVRSSDGKLSLNIPAGDLATETEVRIQPTDDPSGESFGPIYELSPGGVTFAQPVTLAWHLSDADLATTNLDNLVVRTSEGNEEWVRQRGVQRDEATHTITVSTNHFSRWDLAATLRLTPIYTSVYVDDVMNYLEAEARLPPTATKSPSSPKQAAGNQAESDDDLLAVPGKSDDDGLLATPDPQEKYTKNLFRNAVWRVNGVVNGDPKVGQLIGDKIEIDWGSGADEAKVASQHNTYKAPVNVPSTNPVTISVEVTVGRKKMIAAALIHVYPFLDHWKGKSVITQGDGTTVSSEFTFGPVSIPGANPQAVLGGSGSATKHQYEILNGSVHYTGPKTVSGCTLAIRPSSHTMDHKEGTLVVDASNPEQWVFSGQGQSVWLATYTTYCPNGSQSMKMGVSAGWWPINPFAPGSPTIVKLPVPGWPPLGPQTIDINGPMGQGKVQLQYVPKPKLLNF